MRQDITPIKQFQVGFGSIRFGMFVEIVLHEDRCVNDTHTKSDDVCVYETQATEDFIWVLT